MYGVCNNKIKIKIILEFLFKFKDLESLLHERNCLIMESLKSIKNRMKSIMSTKQITESMRTVSTIKQQKLRVKMQNNRSFLNEAKHLMCLTAKELSGENHPYLIERDVKNSALVVIGGDRGLCGGYNAAVGKEVSQLVNSLDGKVNIITVGSKVRDYCNRRFEDKVKYSFTSMSENPFYEDAESIAFILLDWFNKKEIDQVFAIYTCFESMLIQKTEAFKLFPFVGNQCLAKECATKINANEDGTRKIMRYEQGEVKFFEDIIPFYITAFIYGAILESSLCEQSARVASMDSAVKNAEDMIDTLTNTYNQARQKAITQEITEIISGAEVI